MPGWKTLDIAARILILVSIGLQLTVKSELDALNARGDLFYLMENQARISYMIGASAAGREEAAREIDENLQRMTLYSERRKSPALRQARIVNIVFALLFFAGTVTLLLARHGELRERG